MALKISTGLKNQMLNAIKGAVTATASLEHGIIYLYTGTQPANADAAVSGTLLGKVTVSAGAFVWGSATNGLDFNAAASGSIAKATGETWQFVGLADGTAGWFRFMGNTEDSLGSSSSLPRIDGRISTSGAEMNSSNLSIVTGATTTIDSFTLSFPSTL